MCRPEDPHFSTNSRRPRARTRWVDLDAAVKVKVPVMVRLTGHIPLMSQGFRRED